MQYLMVLIALTMLAACDSGGGPVAVVTASLPNTTPAPTVSPTPTHDCRDRMVYEPMTGVCVDDTPREPEYYFNIQTACENRGLEMCKVDTLQAMCHAGSLRTTLTAYPGYWANQGNRITSRFENDFSQGVINNACDFSVVSLDQYHMKNKAAYCCETR